MFYTSSVTLNEGIVHKRLNGFHMLPIVFKEYFFPFPKMLKIIVKKAYLLFSNLNEI
jgi:hypothetical protein